MARGWESKSVESQMDDARDRSKARDDDASREDREQASKRASLELSRSRIQRELDNSRSPAHRAALENALRFLDEELGKLHVPSVGAGS